MEKIKLLSQYYTASELEFIISEILAGEKIQVYYISHKTGQRCPLELRYLCEIFHARPHSHIITFSYLEHMQNLGINDLFADINQTDKLLPALDNTKTAIARRATKDYSTRLIDKLHKAIEKYWLDFDPQSPPKSEVITHELQKDEDLTQNEAFAIDLIIRPDNIKLQKNGATKKKDSAKV